MCILQTAILLLVKYDLPVQCFLCIVEDYNEPATRFAVADPIIKAICKVTGCRIHLERSVLSSDEELDLSESLKKLELSDDEVSRKSVTDGVIYSVKFGQLRKLIIVEVKTDISLSDNSIAQVIGYYMASKLESETIPMALVLAQTKAVLIFFPYRNRQGIYVNAIVTPHINIAGDNLKHLISFLVKYILHPGNSRYAIQRSDTTLHKKESFKSCIMIHEEAEVNVREKLIVGLRQAERKWKEEEKKRKEEEKKRKEEEEKRKEAEDKLKAIQEKYGIDID